MTTPVYTEFPHVTDTGTTALTVVSTVSGKLHTVIVSGTAGSIAGSVTITDNVGVIMKFGTSTPNNSFLFDTTYSQPLSVTLSNASDYVCVVAGPT